MEDPVPQAILKKYNLPSQKTALVWIHEPKSEADSAAARKRFAFEEVFLIQLERMRRRRAYRENAAFEIDIDHAELKSFKARFPFSLTESQERAIEAIIHDFRKQEPMSRLLEGDVGSGKTVVAAATSFAVVTSRPKGQDFGNLQAAVMAPTEILAHQHFNSFITLFSHLPIQIGLITGSGCKKFPSKVNPRIPTSLSRNQFLKWVENGEIPIVVGTHALIQKTVKFKHLAYVVIDEQHRFGTMQRFKLLNKKNLSAVPPARAGGAHAGQAGGIVPHLLSMTATPIPRTLALTIHGDLDLTLLSDMPPGRKEIKTYLVFPHERQYAYDEVKKELRAGRQAYVICPRIAEPDPGKQQALYAKSVVEEAKRLKEIFPGHTIGILHGKMTPHDKEAIMEYFKTKAIDILVTTSVVEVGVNVPNATVILIEGAERFGLAQLHQLRGRVLRSTHQAYCYIFSESKTKGALARLKSLKHARNGFELAEEDLKMRGAGELYGRKQWGISDIGMEAIKNIKMVEAAHTEASALIEKDAAFENHPLIKERVDAISAKMHFE